MRSVSKYLHIISATDSSGGAGMPLDVRIASDMGYWPLCSVSGVTSQTFEKVFSVWPTPDELFREQLNLSLEYDVAVTKIGALFSLNQLKVVSEYLDVFKGQVVFDPVFGPSGGNQFYTSEMITFLVSTLMGKIDVITPNREELERIFNSKFVSVSEAAHCIQTENRGKTVFCIKGGHFKDSEVREAVVGEEIRYGNKKRKKIAYSHGSGCMLSILTACFLGKNIPITKSFFKASKKVSSVLNMYNKFIKQQ